ncbi:Uma2 family endonuclease [Actinoplanes xinjiangensis]|uniref:Uma2 family endonuclease n=1 Tax=Actinoplanes xinjiangensis TaxID=512350 RepID=UPI0019440993|nr:Uma2 family endonuclease [Actinoplanes xinjiangensis]
MSAESAFQWHRPPAEGFTADDLDQIPDLPSHAELIDGSLILVSPQKRFHMKALRLLENALSGCAPRDRFLVSREMSVVLSPKQRPEPDLIVIHANAEIDDDASWYPADAVVLAIEVVSPESEIRDRVRKPQLYAEAGIPCFWRVENAEGKPVVYAYELDPATKAYVALGIFRDRVQLPTPFPLDIDLTEIERM